MAKYYTHVAMAAVALAFPAIAMAQTGNIISASMTEPVPGLLRGDVPRTFTISFETDGLTVNSVKNNTDYTEKPPLDSEGFATWTGLYGYGQLETSPMDKLDSQPLEVAINADKTVTLTLKTDKCAYLSQAMSLESTSFWNFNIILPEGLFTVNCTDEEGQDYDYTSVAQTFTLNHLGNCLLTEANVTPENNSVVTSLKEIAVDFPVNPETNQEIQWQCTTNASGIKVLFRPKGENEWVAGPGVTTPSAFSNPHAQKILIQGQALTEAGQYCIQIPFGAFTLRAETAENGTEIQTYINQEQTLRFAIGEEVSDNIGKAQFLASVIPAEGAVNLVDVPSGVQFIRMICLEAPVINRDVKEPIQLFLDGAAEPIRSVLPSDEEIFYVQEKGISNEYGNEVRLWMDHNESLIVQRGDYTLKFPEGVFEFSSGEKNKAFELKWHIDEQLAYRINPEQEARINSIDKITLTFPNASKIELNPEGPGAITLSTPAGRANADIEIKGKVAYFNLDKEYNETGVYNLTIPSRLFNVTIDNEVLNNQIIEKVYTISEVKNAQIEPAQGILPSNKLDKIKLILGEDDEILAIGASQGYNRLFPMGEDGEPDYSPSGRVFYKVQYPEEAVGGNEITLVPGDDRSVTLKPGNYVFITPSALYTLYSGETPREAKYYWTVLEDLATLAKPAITPAEGNVNDVNFFTLAASEAVTKVNNILSYVYPVNADGTFGPAVATLMATGGTTDKDVDLVAINTIKAPKGKYALVTSKGLYVCGDKQADNYTFYFDLDTDLAVEGIAATDNGLYEVYSLTGVRVLHNATADEVSRLAKGFYIINGKKVVVR
ncbi:MAG: hypothetical protein HDS73_01260 [Bacteroidales bacterium]|nr:hypothetical protein [Bacteroidales bacterium]